RSSDVQLRRKPGLEAGLRDTLGIAKTRFEAGLATELDVARAQGLLDATSAQRPPLERRAKQAVHRLSVLLGESPAALSGELDAHRALPASPDIPSSLPS